MKKIGVVFAFCFVAFIAAGQGKVLNNVSLQGQLKSNWCWAACAQMIDNFYMPSPLRDQCQIARAYLQPLNSSPFTLNCDFLACNLNPSTGNHHNTMLKHAEVNRGYSRLLSNLGYYSSLEYARNSTWGDIINEIDQCRPVVLFVSWTSDMDVPGHVMVIYGYSTEKNSSGISNNYIWVRDPWYPKNNRCDKCNIEKINFTTLETHTSCTLKISGYQMNICLKSESFCSPCSKPERIATKIPEETRSFSLTNEEPITINVKLINYNTNGQDFKNQSVFLPGDLYEQYYPETGRTIGFEKIKGKNLEIEIKNCFYPKNIDVKFHNKSFKISYDGKSDSQKYSLVYAPHPYSGKFYSFINPNTNSNLYVSSEDIFEDSDSKNILFKANEAYTESKFFRGVNLIAKNRLNAISEGITTDSGSNYQGNK
jgi:hypothetical protein